VRRGLAAFPRKTCSLGASAGGWREEAIRPMRASPTLLPAVIRAAAKAVGLGGIAALVWALLGLEAPPRCLRIGFVGVLLVMAAQALTASRRRRD